MTWERKSYFDYASHKHSWLGTGNMKRFAYVLSLLLDNSKPYILFIVRTNNIHWNDFWVWLGQRFGAYFQSTYHLNPW